MDRRLGRPLPCQLANPTRVHLIPPEFFTLYHAVPCAYAVLAAISNCYPPVWGRLPTRYSPVRRSVTSKITRRINRKCFARLACVRHAASVHPEPGSNSQIKVFVQDQNQAWLNFYPVYLLLGCSLRTILFRIVQGYVTVQLSKCFVCCLCISQMQLLYLITSFWPCQQFFYFSLKKFFEDAPNLFHWSAVLFCVVHSEIYSSTVFSICQHLFLFFSNFLVFPVFHE